MLMRLQLLKSVKRPLPFHRPISYSSFFGQQQSQQPPQSNQDQKEPATENATNETPVKENVQPADPVNEKIQTLESQVKEYKDLYLRSLAEMENLRNRTKKEKQIASQTAISSFASDLLNISDILQLALHSIPESSLTKEGNKELNDLYTGLKMTHTELLATFKRHQIVPEQLEIGSTFDPNKHQALFTVKSEGEQVGKVVQIVKQGWQLHGGVLRAAQVGVGIE